MLTSAIGLLSPAIETKAPREQGQSKQGLEEFNAPMGKGLRSWWQGAARFEMRGTSPLWRAGVLAGLHSRAMRREARSSERSQGPARPTCRRLAQCRVGR